jgi:methylmalonyl-CoA mutase
MSAAPPQPSEKPPPENLPLGSLFPEGDRRQWQELVATALRRSGLISEDDPADAVEAVLTTTTYDGIGVLPLYTSDDAPTPGAAGVPGDAPYVRGGRRAGWGPASWDVRQRHADPDPRITREAVSADLENGVSSLWLVVGAGGLPLGSLNDVLRDVHLDVAPVVLDAGADTEAAADEFLALIGGRGVAPESVRGNLGADPIGLRARLGASGTGPDVSHALTLVQRLATRVRTQAPAVRTITVDATVYHDAGGSDAEEIGASLATAVAYLRALTDVGLSIDEAFDQLEFRYAATADQFLTIAKFRAARRVWARVAEVCGASTGVDGVSGQRQHAVTSSAMMTTRDPWVNMLRTTLACFGAGVGGAGAVTVQPFDAALGLPDSFARRIARNTSSLLTMESHVARVIDPAGGSWYVERLTDELAGAAWDWFTEIERAGGIVAALESGVVAERLNGTWERRAAALAHRRDPVTGVSEFPDVNEKPVTRPPLPEGPPIGPGALARRRYAQEYEALRDAADDAAARPAVFLATIGPVAASTARAMFAANLFQAGGFRTPASGDGTDPAAIAEAFVASGTTVACLASSDRLYAEHAGPVAAALKAAGARQIWLAGKPGTNAERYANAGVTGYVYTGVDALGVLRAAQAAAGIRPPS